MLGTSQLSGFGSRAAGGGPATATYIDETDILTGATNYTFSGHAIGAAAADRRVVVGVHLVGGATQGVSSVTVGGQCCAEIVEKVLSVGSGANEQTVGLYEVALAAGTTADIVVNGARSSNGCYIGVWNVNGASGASVFNASDDAAPSAADPTILMDCNANGCVITFSGNAGGSGSTHTWSNVTERFDLVAEVNTAKSGADADFGATQSSLDCSAAWSDALSGGVTIGASWSPS